MTEMGQSTVFSEKDFGGTNVGQWIFCSKKSWPLLFGTTYSNKYKTPLQLTRTAVKINSVI